MKKKLLVYSNLSDIKKQLKVFKEYITIKTELDETSKFDIIYLVLSNANDINKMSKLLNPKGILLVSMPIKNINNLSKKLILIDIIANTYIYGKKIKGGGRPTMSSNEYRNHMHHMSFYDNPYSQSTNYGIPNEQLQYHNQQLEYYRQQQLEYYRQQQLEQQRQLEQQQLEQQQLEQQRQLEQQQLEQQQLEQQRQLEQQLEQQRQLEQQNKITKIDEKDDINKKIDDLARRIKEELKS